MSNSVVLVTFIGGSANLTQRVMESSALFRHYYDVAVMPSIDEYSPSYPPDKVHARRERYNIRMIGPQHAVAIYEHIPQ